MGAIVLTGGRKPRKRTDLRSGAAQTCHASTTTLLRVPAARGRGFVNGLGEGSLVLVIDYLMTWTLCSRMGRIGSTKPSAEWRCRAYLSGLNTTAQFAPSLFPERPWERSRAI